MYRHTVSWLAACTIALTGTASLALIAAASAPTAPSVVAARAASLQPLWSRPTAHPAPAEAAIVTPLGTPGTAAVAEDQTAGATDAAPEDVINATATPTRTPTPINIGNFVWDDLDKDGRQDAGEPGIAGITVQLWNSTKTALLDSATTSASGFYTVTAPLPGSYRVRVLLPGAGDDFSPKDAVSGDDQLDSDINPSGTDFGFTDVFTLASNVISTTIYDAGIIIDRPPTPTRTPTPINIGNFVWHDLNGNGNQDAGEPGVPGITVQLWNSTKTALLDSATTSASGFYTVTAPVPGSYRVRVLLPSGASFAPKDSGSTDQLDSDINPSGTDFGFTDVFTLASNVISTTIYDAGLRNVTIIPTPTTTSTPVGGTPREVFLPLVRR